MTAGDGRRGTFLPSPEAVRKSRRFSSADSLLFFFMPNDDDAKMKHDSRIFLYPYTTTVSPLRLRGNGKQKKGHETPRSGKRGTLFFLSFLKGALLTTDGFFLLVFSCQSHCESRKTTNVHTALSSQSRNALNEIETANTKNIQYQNVTKFLKNMYFFHPFYLLSLGKRCLP